MPTALLGGWPGPLFIPSIVAIIVLIILASSYITYKKAVNPSKGIIICLIFGLIFGILLYLSYVFSREFIYSFTAILYLSLGIIFTIAIILGILLGLGFGKIKKLLKF